MKVRNKNALHLGGIELLGGGGGRIPYIKIMYGARIQIRKYI